MKKVYYLFILMSFSVLLASCSNETEKVEILHEVEVENPLVFKHNEQEFKIINYFQLYLDYIEQVKKQPNNLEEIYKQSIGGQLHVEGFGYDATDDPIFTTSTNIEAMEKSVLSLIENQSKIDSLIKEALKESVDKLPGGNKSVYVFPGNPDYEASMKAMGNVSGMAWDANRILIFINPSFVEQDLKHTVAHEYHHVIYMSGDNAKWFTLLERSILEGKADTFAKNLYPTVHYSYLDPLTGYYEQEGWRTFFENLNSTDASILNEFYYGKRMKGIAEYTTYRIGYQIMESFLKENPNVTIEEWTKMPAEDILLNSKYNVK